MREIVSSKRDFFLLSDMGIGKGELSLSWGNYMIKTESDHGG